MFTTTDCDWSQTSVSVLGAKLVGLRGFEFKTEHEKEHVYGSGKKPISIASGNVKPSGSLKVLKSDYDKMHEAARIAGYENLAEVPYEAIVITCNYKKGTSTLKTTIATGCSFTDLSQAMEQGAKFQEISLPFICMDIIEK